MTLVERRMFIETVLRIFLLFVFLYTETLESFHRLIQKEEWWLYSFPHTKRPAVNTMSLYTLVVVCPTLTIAILSGLLRDKQNNDSKYALLSATLAFCVNGIITNVIKVYVGRPRPDFFKRCFPTGAVPAGQPSVSNLICTGDADLVLEGRKSFPSGHSSMSFCLLGWCSLYIAGKLHVFSSKGKGHSWRFLMALTPLLFATCIAITRISDYRHHWEDVLVGSILGMTIAFVAYLQYYPKLSDPQSHIPLWKLKSPDEVKVKVNDSK